VSTGSDSAVDVTGAPEGKRLHAVALARSARSEYTSDEMLDLKFILQNADAVRANFARYGLLDDRVRLLEGWFSDTLPDAPIDALSVLRLDGDLYESTMDALEHLEPRVSPGGFVIVDDHGGWEPCRAAVADYRGRHGITAPIHEVDWTGAWWRKGA